MSQLEISEALKQEFSDELKRIADWWGTIMLDNRNGGFIGTVDAQNRRIPEADKGIILNTRILWFFSDLVYFGGDACAKAMAKRAFDYLCEYFYDHEQGGFFWSVNAKGELVDGKKQTYAQAFALYGLTSYYRITKDEKALDLAHKTFEIIEQRCHDDKHGGYLEAFTRDWQGIEDMRLSEKDANLPKSQNTHLHILEAYTNLHNIAPSEISERALRRCIDYFMTRIVDTDTWHLRMFMDEQWQDFSEAYSFGHDIEFSWLLHKALKALKDEELNQRLLPAVMSLAQTCFDEGRGADGEVLDEFDLKQQKAHPQSCWWVQAEALVGFLNAYHLSSENHFYQAFIEVWNYTKKEHFDLDGGEWHWLALKDQGENYQECKACFWKAPYHNGRAMMEVIKLLDLQTAKH